MKEDDIKMNKSYEERIAELQKRQNELKEQTKDLQRRAKEAERKKRTRRLIEIGGIVESVLGREFNDSDKMKLLQFLKSQERNGKFFTQAMNQGDPATDTPSEHFDIT